VNLVLDAGALIGIDRDDRRTAGLIELGRRSGATLVTSAPVVGQAWRGAARQARLARLLAMIDVRPAQLVDARAAGELLAATRSADVVDALLAGVAVPGDQLLTSDPDDLGALVAERGIPVTVVAV
jgi:predicted nucleic acid-binding protein